MYKRDFDFLLASKNIPRFVVLYGACEYQLSYLEKMILQLWQGESLKIYFDEYDFKTARAHLSQSSLFGDINILLLKLEKCPPKKEIGELIELCKKQEINRLLFIYYGENTQTFKESLQLFGKNFVRVFKPNPNEAIKFLSDEAKKINLNISGFALQNLYLVQNENLSLAVSELAKLSLLNKEVTIADIDNLVFGMGSVEIETFIIKLLSGEKIITLYKTISESGTVDEIRLINAIQSHLFQLFLFHAYIKINGSFNAEEILGHKLPPQIAKQRSEMAMRIKPKNFAKLFKILANTEFALKTNSNLDKDSYMLSTLLEILEYLKE